jgi:hypothetical protein
MASENSLPPGFEDMLVIEALPGGNALAELKSVSQLSKTKSDHVLPENEPVTLPQRKFANWAKADSYAK